MLYAACIITARIAGLCTWNPENTFGFLLRQVACDFPISGSSLKYAACSSTWHTLCVTWFNFFLTVVFSWWRIRNAGPIGLRGLRHRSAAIRLLRLWFRIPQGDGVCLLLVLSGRGLWDQLLTRPEESYRLWSVVVCDLETSWMRRPWPTGRWCAKRKNEKKNTHYPGPTSCYVKDIKPKYFPEFFVWIYTIHVNVKVKVTQQHAGAGTEGAVRILNLDVRWW